MKDFWKSVKISWSYWHKFTATFLWNTVYSFERWLYISRHVN